MSKCGICFPEAEFIALRRVKHIPTIGEALNVCERVHIKLLNRRSEQTTLQLDREIFRLEAERCTKLLKEIK